MVKFGMLAPLLLFSCESDSGLAQVTDIADQIGDAGEASESIGETTFNKVCGRLAAADAAAFSSASAAESLIAEVYSRDGDCEDGDSSEGCEFSQEGTLPDREGFKISTVPRNDEIYDYYISMSTDSAASLVGAFGVDFEVSTTSYLHIVGLVLSDSTLPEDSRVADAVDAYLIDDPLDGRDVGYIDTVTLYQWDAYEYTYVGVEAEVDAALYDLGSMVEFNGEYYYYEGEHQVIYVLDLCLEPMD